MENISCMRVKYLCEFLTGIEETYTDKNGKIFRISRSARNKLSGAQFESNRVGRSLFTQSKKTMKNTEMLENLTSGFRERRSNAKR